MAEALHSTGSTHPHLFGQSHLPKAERDRLGGWNGLLWMDYMNADGGAARALFEAEIEEIEDFEEEQERLDEAKKQKELELEKAEITEYEEGIDQFDGPLWRNPLHAAAVAAEMNEIHAHPKNNLPLPPQHHERHEEDCEGWENWEVDSEEVGDIGGYEDGIDRIEGPIWDDPLDRKAVARQMGAMVEDDIPDDCSECWNPSWYEEQEQGRASTGPTFQKEEFWRSHSFYENEEVVDDQNDNRAEMVTAAAVMFEAAPEGQSIALCKKCSGSPKREPCNSEHCANRNHDLLRDAAGLA